jgi:CO/xanthine dehydrogenase Mo-binding subunit
MSVTVPQPPYKIVGKYVGRMVDSQMKVTGQMQLGNDFNIPNQAYMKILHSQIPAGTITAMDVTAAKAIPGVLAILTPSDIKNNAQWAAMRWSGVPILPFDQIRVAGEEIAAVAAIDPNVAEEACQAIKVTYQPSGFVLHPLDAIKPNAPQVYTGTNNQASPTTFSFGDADTAMKDSSVQILSVTKEASHEQCNNICTWAFTVRVDYTGRIEMWTSSQGMKNANQASMATWLGVAQSRVRVYNNSGDGGFGDKLAVNRCHVLGALLAQVTGRPIKYRTSQEDNLNLGNHRVKNIFNINVAYKPDGTITALTGTIYGNSAAFGGGGSSGSTTELYAIFKFPNFKFTTYDVYTNTPKSGAVRCVADPYACWVINSTLDQIANKLGMKYSDLIRKNNLYQQGDPDQQTGNRIISIGLTDCFTKALTLSGFDTKWKAAPTSLTGITGVKHGIGLALHACGHGSGSSTSATVLMRPDASLEIHAGTNEIGEGKREEITSIAAEHMGLPFGMVTLCNYDSDDGTDTGSSGGSTQTKRAGNSVGAACMDAKNQMMSKAAVSLNTTVDKLTYALDGSMKIFLTADPTKSVTFTSLTSEPVILGLGRYIVPGKTTMRTYGAQVAEVDVDTDTGVVKVTEVYAVHDVGRVITPLGIQAQAHGGIMEGLAIALMMEQWPDGPTGKQLNINKLDHKMAEVSQIPNFHFDWVETVEQPPDSFNFGAKGFAEPPVSPSLAAILNAIANAIGWYPDTLPVTPDKVLKALGKA